MDYNPRDLEGKTKFGLRKILEQELGGVEGLKINDMDNAALIAEILRRQAAVAEKATADEVLAKAAADKTAAEKATADRAAAEEKARLQTAAKAAAERSAAAAIPPFRRELPPPAPAFDIDEDEDDEEDEEDEEEEEEFEEDEEDEEDSSDDEVPFVEEPQPVSQPKAQQKTVRVSCGACVKSFPVVGQTVGAIRATYRELLNIGKNFHARIGGIAVPDSTVVKETDKTLEFTAESGDKS